MKKKFLNKYVARFLLFFVFTCTWVLPLHATIIDNGTYTTVNGLDFMDLIETTDKSIEQAETIYPDWHVASHLEMQHLYQAFFTYNLSGPDSILGVESPVNMSDDINAPQWNTEFADSDYASMLFHEYFGVTDGGWLENTIGIEVGLMEMSHGVYKDGIDIKGVMIAVEDYYDPTTLDKIFKTTYTCTSSCSSPYAGVFMVRENSQLSNIPEPSAFALICLGLLGFGVYHRNHIESHNS